MSDFDEKDNNRCDAVSEPAIDYGDLNSMKVQLVNSIMRMDLPQVSSVFNFVEKQKKAAFQKRWNEALTVDEFNSLCDRKLAEIYGSSSD